MITNVARQHFDFRRGLCSQSQQRPQPDTNQSTTGSSSSRMAAKFQLDITFCRSQQQIW